jgi:hypothetical protein
MRVYRLLGLLLVMVWASAAGASTDCTAPIPSEPSQAFLYVTDCGSAAHLGFATRWQPSGGTTQLSLPRTDQTEGLSYTAVWVQTAAGEDLVHAQDQTDAALQRAARLAFAQSLAPAAILDRTDSDDGRAILLTLSVPEPDNPWLYRNHDLLVFGREDGRIVTLTRVRSRITAPWTSRVLVAVATLAGLSFLYRGLTDSRRRNGSHRRLFAGPTGRMSLANTQIAFFSTIVFVLSVQHLARTGTVGDLSVEVLGLLGILAVGSATGRVADIRVERLGLDNWLWLRQQKWLRDAQESLRFRPAHPRDLRRLRARQALQAGVHPRGRKIHRRRRHRRDDPRPAQAELCARPAGLSRRPRHRDHAGRIRKPRRPRNHPGPDGQTRRRDRPPARRAGHPRESRPQPLYRRRRAPHGEGRLPRPGPGRPHAAGRLSRHG